MASGTSSDERGGGRPNPPTPPPAYGPGHVYFGALRHAQYLVSLYQTLLGTRPPSPETNNHTTPVPPRPLETLLPLFNTFLRLCDRHGDHHRSKRYTEIHNVHAGPSFQRYGIEFALVYYFGDHMHLSFLKMLITPQTLFI